MFTLMACRRVHTLAFFVQGWDNDSRVNKSIPISKSINNKFTHVTSYQEEWRTGGGGGRRRVKYIRLTNERQDRRGHGWKMLALITQKTRARLGKGRGGKEVEVEGNEGRREVEVEGDLNIVIRERRGGEKKREGGGGVGFSSDVCNVSIGKGSSRGCTMHRQYGQRLRRDLKGAE
ncbi:hypothetical protein BDQ17DRAFT_1330590 [Cyathus striatus]|nr:hypothetical protein BDQ17DRAFT_1330590 [Cyathus striatus]